MDALTTDEIYVILKALEDYTNYMKDEIADCQDNLNFILNASKKLRAAY